MSRLIDADRLLNRTKFYDLPNGNRAIDEIDILHAPTVDAIPLDRVKQARERIKANSYFAYSMTSQVKVVKLWDVLEILDKLISEDGRELEE